MTGDGGTGDGFDLLSDETRVGILRALVDRLRENPDDPTLGFAELRRRVGVRDSGNFNYHLEKVEGRFVRQTDDGYRIGTAGLRVVTAIITGVYGERDRRGPVDLEDPCPACSEPRTATYEDGVLRIACPNDHDVRNPLPPGAMDERSMAEAVALAATVGERHVTMAIENVCPFCYGRLEWSLAEERLEGTAIATRCSRCGVRVDVPVVACLARDPAVVSFYHDHGIDLLDRPPWDPAYADVEVSFDGTDRLRVDVALEGERLEATVDDSLSVESVTIREE